MPLNVPAQFVELPHQAQRRKCVHPTRASKVDIQSGVRSLCHQVADAIDMTDSGSNPLFAILAIDDSPDVILIQSADEFEILAVGFEAMPAPDGVLRLRVTIGFEVRIESVLVKHEHFARCDHHNAQFGERVRSHASTFSTLACNAAAEPHGFSRARSSPVAARIALNSCQT